MNVDELLKELSSRRDFLFQDDMRPVARELMKGLDMVRAFECDYELCLKVFRAVYDAGRSRGVNEAGSGCMG